MKPGVQKPHCRPWHSWKACWTGPSSPSGSQQPFDGRHGVAVGGDREDEAGADRDAVEQHRARAADAVLAAEVRAGQAEVHAQEVGQQPARRGLAAPGDAVDGHGDLMQLLAHGATASYAAFSERAVRTRARCLRYSALAWMSSSGSSWSRRFRRRPSQSVPAAGHVHHLRHRAHRDEHRLRRRSQRRPRDTDRACRRRTARSRRCGATSRASRFRCGPSASGSRPRRPIRPPGRPIPSARRRSRPP